MTEALELAIYLQRKLKYATDSCLSRNTCFRELNYARSEETRIQRELVLLKKRGQHIDPNITKHKRKLRTLHLINLRRDQTQLMDQITYYTRVAKVVNNSIPLIKKAYLDGANNIKDKFTNQAVKEEVADALDKLKTAKTKCEEIASIQVITKALQPYVLDKKSPESNIGDTSGSQTSGNTIGEGDESNAKELQADEQKKGESQSSNRVATNVTSDSDDQNSGFLSPDDINRTALYGIDTSFGSYNNDTCPLEDYIDLVGWVDRKNLDQAEKEYNELRSEIEDISSKGVPPSTGGNTDRIKLASSVAFWFLGTTMAAFGGPLTLAAGTVTAIAATSAGANALSG